MSMKEKLRTALLIIKQGNCTAIHCFDCPCWSETNNGIHRDKHSDRYKCIVSMNVDAVHLAQQYVNALVIDNPEETFEELL